METTDLDLTHDLSKRESFTYEDTIFRIGEFVLLLQDPEWKPDVSITKGFKEHGKSIFEKSWIARIIYIYPEVFILLYFHRSNSIAPPKPRV
jgi:hypothetical protein